MTVTVTCPETIQSAKVLPSSFDIQPTVEGNRLRLTLTEPKPLTIEVNGNWAGALHLFANPPETDAPRPGDPNVLYFGPGIHEVSHLVVSNNQTVYVAGGAVVRGVIRPDEKFRISSYSGLRTYSPTFVLQGHQHHLPRARHRGRQPLHHARAEPGFRAGPGHHPGGRDPARFQHLDDSHPPVRPRPVQNVKLLGYRANSDGIDICNSRDVTVEGCFIRTLDDLIVVKTDQGQGEARRIVARDCVLWNEVAHALSIGAELRENVDDVLFTDCDVIHDKGREWTLARLSLRLGAHQQRAVREPPHRGVAAADLALDRQGGLDPRRRSAGTSTA